MYYSNKFKIINILLAVICLISAILIFVGNVYSNKEIYGNNRESIIECIKSDPIIEDKNDLVIADIIDVDKTTRIVGFFSNGGTGVATFIKNKNNNYKMEQIDIHENTTTSYFHIINRDTDDIKFVVVSNGNSLDKIVVKENGKYRETSDNLIGKMSVSVLDYNIQRDQSNSSASIPIEIAFLGINGGPVSFD